MKIFLHLVYASILIASAGCWNNSQTWEDVKTAGRYMQKGVDVLRGKDYESRMLTSDEEFTGPNDSEFIPLSDSDLKHASTADTPLPQPKGLPGKKGIPPLDQFYVPSEELRSLFQTVHFETDDHILRDKKELQSIFQIAEFLKKHPNVFVTITGHCDERASASYNIALGMRRAQSIRGLLVKSGVDLNRIYTISRGKEEPLITGHTSSEWKINRRAEFKIFEKR